MLSIYMLDTIEQYFFNREEMELLTRANIVAGITSRHIEYRDDAIARVIDDMKIDRAIRVIITDKEAIVLFDNREESDLEGKVLLKEEIIHALNGKDAVRSNYEESSGWVINTAVRVIKDREIIGVVFLTTSAERIVRFVEDIRNKLFIISLVVSIFIGFFSSILARIITAPILNFTAAIKNMEDEKTIEKVPVTGNDEITQLGKAFNKMSERLNEEEEKRKVFVSNASHELRTPLSSIKVMADSLLQFESLDMSIVKEFLGDINNEIDRLSRIVNKLLLLTKMDAEEKELEMKKVDIKKVIDSVYKSLLPLAKEKNVHLDYEVADSVFMKIDEDKMWEAIFNIVDNSIKYTSANGKVSIRMHKTRQDVQIIIEDSGIGIPAHEIDKIFGRFYRVDKARARETGGTGLGLSIAMQAVKSHSGDIEVSSEEGIGSVFNIILPSGIIWNENN